MTKINTIVFGLCGLDTAAVVRMMKKRIEFGKVIWFGVFEDSDFNLHETYKFHSDYNYSIDLPEDYWRAMHQVLGEFLVSSARRNEATLNGITYTLSFGSTYEYLHHFSRYCYLIYELIVKNEINLIIIDGAPHTSIDVLLCQAARYFKIKILYLYQPNIPNRFMYFSEPNELGIDFSLYYSDKARPAKKSAQYTVNDPEVPFYMKDFSPYYYTRDKYIKELVAESGVKPSKSHFKKFGFSFLLCKILFMFRDNLIKMQSISTLLLKTIKYQIYSDNITKQSAQPIDFEAPYVYFPLNCQPEITTECLANQYIDILTAIEKVRCLIPENWKIYIKDHQVQYEFARDQVFFDRLQGIPNLFIVGRDASPFDLMRNAKFVATVNGTSGWEAIHMGKNVLNFGTIYYQGLPGVFVYNTNIRLEDIINFSIDKKALEVAIATLISRMEVGIVNADYSACVENFDEEENAKIVSDFICKIFSDQSKINLNTKARNEEYTT